MLAIAAMTSCTADTVSSTKDSSLADYGGQNGQLPPPPPPK